MHISSHHDLAIWPDRYSAPCTVRAAAKIGCQFAIPAKGSIQRPAYIVARYCCIAVSIWPPFNKAASTCHYNLTVRLDCHILCTVHSPKICYGNAITTEGGVK